MFILVLAGGAWAGVCPCVDQGVKMASCCKSKKQQSDSVGKKKCCSSVCGVENHGVHLLGHAEKTGRQNAEADKALEAVSSTVPEAVFTLQSFRTNAVNTAPSKLRRAATPLYLLHSSFLI